MSVFVDTSAWYALADEGDRFHPVAAKLFQQLLHGREKLTTSDWVFVETVALTEARRGRNHACALGRILIETKSLQIYPMNLELREKAWRRYESGSGRLSLVDCGSFTLMEHLDIRRAFAFDEDFAEAGFERLL